MATPMLSLKTVSHAKQARYPGRILRSHTSSGKAGIHSLIVPTLPLVQVKVQSKRATKSPNKNATDAQAGPMEVTGGDTPRARAQKSIDAGKPKLPKEVSHTSYTYSGYW
ncbi:hypothetical protein BGZ82_005275, partial [Podila clonocystis]